VSKLKTLSDEPMFWLTVSEAPMLSPSAAGVRHRITVFETKLVLAHDVDPKRAELQWSELPKLVPERVTIELPVTTALALCIVVIVGASYVNTSRIVPTSASVA
jgi:hypothetical protein